MGKFIIRGGRQLEGDISINGAKNSVLPVLAATVLTDNECVIHNVPEITDVRIMIEILVRLGAKVWIEREPDGSQNIITVKADALKTAAVPESLMSQMRSSIFLMGPLLGRLGVAKISQPGGCSIGPRPINLHLDGLSALGMDCETGATEIVGRAPKLRGNEVRLAFPSVGATENIMMAAVLAEGETTLKNPAREPEIVDLQGFLNAMGANVKGAGTDEIRIEGVTRLHGYEEAVIPDRIEAGTFMAAATMTGGDVTLKKVRPDHLEAVISKLKQVGAAIDISGSTVRVRGPIRPGSFTLVTGAYPGFPTDMQPQMVTLAAVAEGVSTVEEGVFKNRFAHVDDLNRLGADIKLEGSRAVVRGANRLQGGITEARDLRNGAALVLAGLVADGETTVQSTEHIDRGYERLELRLRSLGADVKRAWATNREIPKAQNQ